MLAFTLTFAYSLSLTLTTLRLARGSLSGFHGSCVLVVVIYVVCHISAIRESRFTFIKPVLKSQLVLSGNWSAFNTLI